MNKKGQVTVFIILGVLLLLAVAIVLMLRSSIFEEAIAEEAQETEQAVFLKSSVREFVQSCMEQTAEDAVVFIGQRGGYYDFPDVFDPRFSLPYYFYEEDSTYPSQRAMEEHLSEYVNHMLFFCTRNFVPFREQGYEITVGEVEAKATMAQAKVRFEVQYPLAIRKGDAAASLEQFSVEISARLGVIYGVIEEFLRQQEENPSSICISCLVRLAVENDLRVEMYFVREGEIMFTIVDEKIPVKDEPYTYSFLNRYIFAEPETDAVAEP